jgi:MurNAc alpha-1-phosphate uridylyltransferase
MPVTTMGLRPNPDVQVPETAMVMAAGLGKRMRPLTATRPKPLVEVAGRALVDHVFDRLRAAGVKRAVVNVHYLADAMEAYLKHRVTGIEVVISDERKQLLETGGGLVQALPLIGTDKPFLQVNSDNFWLDGPSDSIVELAARWDDDAMDALLLMVPLANARSHRGRGDFRLDPRGRIVGRRERGKLAPYVWTGVQILSPRLIVDAPEPPFSTNIFWDRAIAAGRAYGVVHEGLWFDVGTPAAIPMLEAELAEA